ncbi:MAG: hypothetical protein KME54_25305 [Tolypothrix brevis GSE-NOS-MK-07-07A]|jgi:hypothetical protein|nr:hypothetical protein [Tolypothrix brevis GSE-NOS-MK-07-07A]
MAARAGVLSPPKETFCNSWIQFNQNLYIVFLTLPFKNKAFKDVLEYKEATLCQMKQSSKS